MGLGGLRKPLLHNQQSLRKLGELVMQDSAESGDLKDIFCLFLDLPDIGYGSKCRQQGAWRDKDHPVGKGELKEIWVCGQGGPKSRLHGQKHHHHFGGPSLEKIRVSLFREGFDVLANGGRMGIESRGALGLPLQIAGPLVIDQRDL